MAKNSAHGIRGPRIGSPGSSRDSDDEGSRVFQASAHTFDVAIGDIVASLACGATLCTASRRNVLERLGWCLKVTSGSAKQHIPPAPQHTHTHTHTHITQISSLCGSLAWAI